LVKNAGSTLKAFSKQTFPTVQSQIFVVVKTQKTFINGFLSAWGWAVESVLPGDPFCSFF
jgi:hypothetical protein